VGGRFWAPTTKSRVEFPRAIAEARKYVIIATNTDNVIQFDLQQKFEDSYIQQLGTAITEPKK
jgi:hypothetical protein